MKSFLYRGIAGTTILALAAAQQAQAPAQAPSPRTYQFEAQRMTGSERADFSQQCLLGGFRLRIPSLQLEVRGTNALLLLDVETARALFDQPSTSGLPRRGIDLPAPRRRLSADELRGRLERTLQALGQEGPAAPSAGDDRALELVRYLYFEGGVTVLRGGVEVIRCERMWVSPLDDRITIEDAEVRYQAAGDGTAKASTTLVVRGPRLDKSGGRWTGRDLTITSCTAAEPHLAVAVGEAEILEREGEFEILARGQRLQIGRQTVMPLPDAHLFTGSQTQFPIRRVSAGYSAKEGYRSEIVFGLPWNDTGGALHEAITGRPADEFRGDWELGVGWIQERGEPLSGELEYRVPGLYEGRTNAYWLDDSGINRREVVDNFDGTRITEQNRGLLRTQNRVHFGTDTHLDLQAFQATDPAVLPEFFRGDYRSREVPETSGYLHHGNGNHLFTVGTRFNLDDFSYRDNRSLADRFVEEEPVVTWNWIAQPIAETPWETPIVLDLATEVGERRSNYDDRGPIRVGDRTLRADQSIELSAPFALGELHLRPYVASRGTWYDNSIDGDSEGRLAWEGGVQAGTRLSRTWNWTDEQGQQGLRHVIAPRFTFANRFRVDDAAAEFHQFDTTDTLREQNLLRFEVRNLVQRMEPVGQKTEPRDFLMVDLAQDLWPSAARDNDGDQLGLLYYDVLVRPKARWVPFETFSFGLYGDHDWHEGLRTLDTELQFGRVLGLTWTAEYRTDREVQGAVGLSASTSLLGRWDLVGNSLYELEEKEFLTYGFGLRRNDHDWALALTINYDPFAEETSFTIDFEPRVGGLVRSREDRFGGSHLQDTGMATQF